MLTLAFSSIKRINSIASFMRTTIASCNVLSLEFGTKGFSADFTLYKVKPGDSLEKIARTHKISVEKIKKLNGLDQDLIVVGQELKIPAT